jgi:type VI secretion system protein ImpL
MRALLEALLRDHLGLALAAVGLLLAVVLWLLLRLVTRTRARADVDRDEALDLTLPPRRPDLRRSFARARGALRRAFPGRGEAYRRPWVLVLGRALAGKTTLLGRSGLGAPFGQPRQGLPADHPGINWWAMEGGVALDVVGEDLLRLDGLSSDAEEWKRILRRIRRSRRRRPIDGIVLTLPASDFLDEKKPLAQRLAEASRRGTLLHRKLSEAQRALRMRLPVYLLISHCDSIPGFSELLMPEGGSPAQREQILGWSNPALPTAPYSAAWIDSAFGGLGAELEGFQLQALAEGTAASTPDAVSFPSRVAALREPLRICANHLFSPSAAGDPPIFRGVYLCGGRARRRGADPAATEGGAAVEMPSEVAFVADLFNRKVFAEAEIARPAAPAVARARLARALLAGIAMGALVWTAWWVWGGASHLRSTAAKIEPFLASAALDLESASRGSDASSSLLADGARVPSFRLRSAAPPASWLSPLPSWVARAVERAFLELALDPSRVDLEQRTERLITKPAPQQAPALGARSTVYAVDGYPEFAALDDLTRELERLERWIAGYQRFTPAGRVSATGAVEELNWLERWIASYQRFPPVGRVSAAAAVEEFNRLAVVTLNDQLRPSGRGPARYFGRRLSGIEATPFDYRRQSEGHVKGYDERLESEVIARAKRYFDAAFTDNPLLTDMEAVMDYWIEGGAWRRPQPSEVQRYRQLRDALRRASRHAGLAELKWTAADSLNLGPGFDQILKRIHASPFLGPEVSDRLKGDAVTRFGRLQNALGIYATPDTGVFLLREDEAWTLSPRLQAVYQGVDGLLVEPFMQRRCTPRSVNRAPEGDNLFWKSAPLERALALYAAYEEWDGSSELPVPLRATAPEAATDSIAENLVCMIAEAQTLEPPPGTTDVAVIEDNIKLQVQNLQAVEGTLQGLLDALGRLELRSDQSELAQILRDQRIQVLGQLDSLLAALSLYSPLEGGFGWWQGAAAPALEAFGAASPDELTAYLETQRQIAGRLASEYAQPLLAMFGASGQLALLQPVPPAAGWERIVADLGAYGDKRAGNPLARLEELVTTLAGVEKPEVFDLYACFDKMPAAATPGGDFFLGRREALRSALVERCGQLADEQGHEKYVRLAGIFNQRLEGAFPFSGPGSEEGATPEDIRAFFAADFEKALVLIENLPADSSRFGGEKEAVQRFMRQMDEVREFFASFLAPEAASPVPIFNLAVRFRIERTLEWGANQIISWLMTVGEPAGEDDESLNGEKVLDLLATGSVSPAQGAEEAPEHDARWVYGRPVTLRFRWAKESPYAPYVPVVGASTRRSIDGRTLAYRYRDPWSLLRLLAENPAPVEEFADLTDPRPETVKLSIDTISIDRPDPRTVAEIYLQVTLLSAVDDGKLQLPDFPSHKAPLTGFPERRCTLKWMERTAEGPDLFWDSDLLEHALNSDLLERALALDARLDGSDRSAAPRDASPKAALEELEELAESLVCLVAEAQTLKSPPAADEIATVIEDNIELQVRNLQAAESTLQELLHALGRLELRAEQAKLAQILRHQRIHILGQLESLLAAFSLYAPLDGGFGWWQGTPAPALQAFGAANAAELRGHLETQRRIVRRLASDYALPLLAMFEASGRLGLLQQAPPAAFWQRVVYDLWAYDAEQAGNPLARLEELIATLAGAEQPDLFDLSNCSEAMPAAVAPGDDFFLDRRQALRDKLLERCEQLAPEPEPTPPPR